MGSYCLSNSESHNDYVNPEDSADEGLEYLFHNEVNYV